MTDERLLVPTWPSAEGETAYVEDPPQPDDLPIHRAAHDGDIAQLASLIKSTRDIDVRGQQYCTPLQLAIRANHGKAVQMLLEAGADPLLEDDIEPCYFVRHAAVEAAALLGSSDALAALIDAGVEVPSLSLSLAASVNRVSCIRIILDRLQGKDFADKSEMETVREALERAALCWHADAVDYFLKHVEGFPCSEKLEDRDSLARALISVFGEFDCDDRCRYPFNPSNPGRQRRTRQLLSESAGTFSPNILTAAFWTSLCHLWVPRSEVRWLMELGLPMAGSEDGGFTPPLFGIVEDSDDDPSLIEDFIAAGAGSTATDLDLNTALHRTTQRTFAEVLLREGADLYACNTAGETPLHKACERENLHLVEFFLSQGLDVNAATTHSRWTPLMYAVHEPESWSYGHAPSRFTLAKLLVQHGADVDAVAADGTTALHLAAESGATEIFRLLIDQGADSHATTVARKTVLHSVCLRHDAAKPGWSNDFGRSNGSLASVVLFEVLMDRGAVSDLEARDEKGRTALQLSFAFHMITWIPELSNALLRRGANRMVTDDEGKTFIELVGASKWCFGEDGLLKERPKPVPARVAYGRGRGGVRGRGRGRGRGGV